MKSIGELFGAQVEMDYSDGVRIVFRWRLGDADQAALAGLGQALGGFARLSCDGDQGIAEIVYTDGLDRRLMALVDLMITMRYAHPRMVQLPLALTDEEAAELEGILGQ